MDDILTGETFPEKVGEEAAAIRQVVNKAEIYIPSGKYPGPRKEGQTLSAEIEHKETVKFLTEELKNISHWDQDTHVLLLQLNGISMFYYSTYIIEITVFSWYV